jgi:Fic family protein
MDKYIYERPDWTNFTWDSEKISILLERVNNARGLLLGKMQLLGLIPQDEICLNVIADGIAKTSQDTAARDIARLVSWGVLTKVGGGRGTHYRLSV